MAKESSNGAISSDSIGVLEEVKKGKQRKFAMICKGVSIVSLVVYKKGNVEKRKKEAKEAGKGQFYFGVVDGSGLAFRFVLARADGFESEPVKNSVLKNFLDESAQLKCKPFFEIVDVLPLVLDEDDLLVARFLQLQEAARAACAPYPDKAAEINNLCSLIGKHLDQDESDEATVRLIELDGVLSSLASVVTKSQVVSSPSPVPSEADRPHAPSSSNAAIGFTTRLKALKPAIDAAIAAPNANPDIKLRFSEMALFARKKEFEAANDLLNQVEAMLKPSAPPPPSDAANQFMSRLRLMKPVIDAAMTAQNANPDIKLRFSEVAIFARKKEFASANTLLDQIAKLIAERPTEFEKVSEPLEKEGISLVELGKMRLEWDAVRVNAIQEIQRLVGILEIIYGEREEQEALKAASDRLQSIIDSLNEELGDRLDAVLNALPTERAAPAKEAKMILDKFISYVGTDPIVTLIDGNEFDNAMLVREPLESKLRDIANALKL